MRGNSRFMEYLKVGKEVITLEVRIVDAVTDNCPDSGSRWLLPCDWVEIYQILHDAALDHLASNGCSASSSEKAKVVQCTSTQVAYQFKKCSSSYHILMLPFECDDVNPEAALSQSGNSWPTVTPHRDMLIAAVIPSFSKKTNLPLPETPATKCTFTQKSSFFTDSCASTQMLNIYKVIPESDDDNSRHKFGGDDEDMFHAEDSSCAQQWNDDSSSDKNPHMTIEESPVTPSQELTNTDVNSQDSNKSESDTDVTQEDIESYFNSPEAETSPVSVSPSLHSKQDIDSFSVDSDSDSESDEIDYYQLISNQSRHKSAKTFAAASACVAKASGPPDVHSIFKRQNMQSKESGEQKRRKLFDGNKGISPDIQTMRKKRIVKSHKKQSTNKVDSTREKITRKITEYFSINDSKVGSTPEPVKKHIDKKEQRLAHALQPANLNTSQSSVNTNNDDQVILVEDDDESYNNSQPNFDLKHLSLETLEIAFERNKSYLHNLFKGKFECYRHEQYKMGGIARRELNYSLATLPFNQLQQEHMLNLMMKKFCKDSNALSFLDYMLKVLLPELATKIFMDKFNMNHEEALDKIGDVYTAAVK